VAVICVLLNGEHYVRSFMDHYGGMGVSHFYFLDNGSTDATVRLLSEYEGVTVLHSALPYRRYENTFKRYLAERFGKGAWVLCSDIDELLDYPYSDRMGVHGLIRYLDEHGYTAVVTQMLDMFSDRPLADSPETPYVALQEECPLYDLSAIRKRDYPFEAYGSCEAEPARAIFMHRGGVRERLFGVKLGLTKVSLFKMEPGVKPFVGWHHVKNVRFADLSCVLLHYPFAGAFGDKIRDALTNARYDRPFTKHYRAYEREVTRNPDLNLALTSARRYAGVGPLIEQGFVYVSERFTRWGQAYLDELAVPTINQSAIPDA